MIRLLIADDERMEREALADIVMRRFEHEVTVEMAENGRKAADTAVLWEADLILMDIEMPGMNGLDAARAVLEQRPECKVIFITAYSLFQYAHEAVHLGACDYLLKPVDPDETEAAIRRAIRQIEAGRRLAELAAEAPEPETAPAQEVTSDAEPQAAPAETLTELQEKALEIADRYKDLPLQAKIDVIAQAFGCKTGEIHTSPCTGKWRGTSDMTIRFDNGASLFIGNHLTPKAKTVKVQTECVNRMISSY